MVEDGVPRRAPLPSSNLVPFGRWWHARSREHCRGELGSAILGGYAPDSARAEGSLIIDEPGECNPCARESKGRTGRSLRERLIPDHGLFSSYDGRQGAANGQDSWGFFRAALGFGRLDAGSRAGFSSRPPTPWTSVFHFSYSCMMCSLEKLGLVDQN